MLLISTFIKDYAYKPIERIFIGYCMYSYLTETYQLEDEAIQIYEEIKRLSEQIADMGKKNNCDIPFKRIIGNSYSCLNPYFKFRYTDKIVTELKKLNKYVYIDIDIIESIGSDIKKYNNFFLNI